MSSRYELIFVDNEGGEVMVANKLEDIQSFYSAMEDFMEELKDAIEKYEEIENPENF